MWQYNSDDLAHYGVLGMKWGRRRAQRKEARQARKAQRKLNKEAGKALRADIKKEAKLARKKAVLHLIMNEMQTETLLSRVFAIPRTR